jgi:hypothetical protein
MVGPVDAGHMRFDEHSTPSGGVRAMTVRAWSWLRRFHDEQVEMNERLWLLNSPWEEEYLHWAADGTLHGRFEPPPGRRRGVTKHGWCIGLRDRHLDDAFPPGLPR